MLHSPGSPTAQTILSESECHCLLFLLSFENGFSLKVSSSFFSLPYVFFFVCDLISSTNSIVIIPARPYTSLFSNSLVSLLSQIQHIHRQSTFPPDFHVSMNGATIFLDTQILGDSHPLPPFNFSWAFFCSKLSWHTGYKLTRDI